MADTLRVATWNLWWRHGDWQERQEGIADTLATVAPDVLACQEVSATEPDHAAWLADRFGYHVAVAPHSEDAPTSMLNAIASRWRIVDSDWAFLDVGEMPPHRTVLRASLDAPFGSLDVYCTHLSHGFDQSALRQRQLRQVAELVADRRPADGHGYPPLLLGDLNAVPDSDEIRMMTGRAAAPVAGLVFTDVWEQVGEGTGATYSEHNQHVVDSAWPERRLDYVLVGWPRQRPSGNPVRAELFGDEPVRGRFPSDHFGVVADLRL